MRSRPTIIQRTSSLCVVRCSNSLHFQAKSIVMRHLYLVTLRYVHSCGQTRFEQALRAKAVRGACRQRLAAGRTGFRSHYHSASTLTLRIFRKRLQLDPNYLANTRNRWRTSGAIYRFAHQVTAASSKAQAIMSAIFMVRPNAPDQRSGATDRGMSTRASSPGSLNLVGSAGLSYGGNALAGYNSPSALGIPQPESPTGAPKPTLI